MSNFRSIVEGGYCVGCGTCKNISGFKGAIKLDKYGMYIPSTLEQLPIVEKQILKICPFSNEGPNEDDISKKLFKDETKFNDKIGYYKNLYAGHVQLNDYRAKGTSGGVITWLLASLLKLKKVDYVIHIQESNIEGKLFEYKISKTIEEVKNGAKSRYYPIELSEVLDIVQNQPGKYALVGLPCFIKSVRRLSKIDNTIDERIKLYIGLVCGHLKSTGFAESLAWQCGVKPNELKNIDFRVKLPDSPAHSYGTSVKSSNLEQTVPVKSLIGSNWGHNFFRNPACNFCDDVFAETADICVGDAWLEQYSQDSKGTSVVVVRNKLIDGLISEAIESNQLAFDSLSEEDVIQSQAGGLRDRREGLAYRLFLKEQEGSWVPRKRVQPNNSHIGKNRKKIYELREESSIESQTVWFETKKQNNLNIFINYSKSFNRNYKKYNFPLISRVKNRMKTLITKMVMK